MSAGSNRAIGNDFAAARPRSIAAVIMAGLVALVACESDEGVRPYAHQIDSTADLIGGPGALGAVGDWVMGNNRIRIIIQDQGWSRGFGIFGGGLIDADIVRPHSAGDAAGGTGRDNFGEFFPALFLEAFDVGDRDILDPQTRQRRTVPGIEVLSPDDYPQARRDALIADKAVVLRTRATGGNFFTMVGQLNDIGVALGIRYETDYILRPGARHVEIVGRVINGSAEDAVFPDSDLQELLRGRGVEDFELPLGDVALFGEGNHVFAPGAVFRPEDPTNPKPAGFDLRFAVEEGYRLKPGLPAFPGLVVDFLATAGEDVSYGIAVGESDNNFVWLHRDLYGVDPQAPISKHAMLVPFLVDSFTGVYYERPPLVLPAGEAYEYTKYFIVGSGDVASIRDELYKIRGQRFGQFFGEVRDTQTGEPLAGAWIHLFDSDERPYSQLRADADGRFRCRLEPGAYFWVATAEGRHPQGGDTERFTLSNRFEISKPGDEIYRSIGMAPTANIIVNVRDSQGLPIPAKVSVVGSYELPQACRLCTQDCLRVCSPRNYLFDLSLGEERKPTDLAWRGTDNRPGRAGEYVEARFFAEDGTAFGSVRPNCAGPQDCQSYEIYVSRGPEYDLGLIQGVQLAPGQTLSFDVELKRSVATDDYLAADFHVHSEGSVDSNISLHDRVITGAAEGLELLVSTDHNYIVDFGPAISAAGIQDHMNSIVGVELSTLEMGHFNAFPVEPDASTASHFPYVATCFDEHESSVNRTSFDWVECSPHQMFNNIRALGPYSQDDTIVQVNHPRSPMLGYFNQYYVNPYLAEPELPTEKNYPSSGLVHPENESTGQWRPEAFSFDFDAMEVLNGKRMDRMHAFVMPSQVSAEILSDVRLFQCDEGGHPGNGPGEVLKETGGFPSFPGAVDDWMNLLNKGYRITATANSDSHGVGAEIGFPRTYVRVARDADGESRDGYPGAIHELEVVQALRQHRAFATTGPFFTMDVLTGNVAEGTQQRWQMGDTIYYGGDNRGREVRVYFTVRSTPWIDVEEILVYANGEIIDTIEIPQPTLEELAAGQVAQDDNTAFERIYTFDEDTVLVAEALGSKSLFPVVTPNETPPTDISAAIGAILGSIVEGIFVPQDGVRAPDPVQVITPYAITNPIWLDIDGSQTFEPPGNVLRAAPAPEDAFGVCSASLPCPENQFCDMSQATPICACIPPETGLSVSPAERMNMDLVRMMFEPMGPKVQGKFEKWDIRQLFIGHDHGH